MFCACIIDCRKRLSSTEIGWKEIERLKSIRTFHFPSSNVSLNMFGCIVVRAKSALSVAITVIDCLCQEKYSFVHPVLLGQVAIISPSLTKPSFESIEGKTHFYLVRKGKLNILNEESPE